MKIAVIYRELFLLLLTIAYCRNAPTNNYDDKHYWFEKNRHLLEGRIRGIQKDMLPIVNNVVIFVGDGMGLTTITASRQLKRQRTQNPNSKLIFDDFPATAFMQTDIINSQISESAASATALFCGVKTNFESLGVDTTAMGKDACRNTASHTSSIITWAQKKNLRTGFVTTTRITHATPAALYAHSRRHIEDDSRLESSGCSDIARQLIENSTGYKMNVIMGGGMRSFIPESNETGGRRKDGRNLTAEWIDSHPNGKFVTSLSELMNVSSHTDHLLGIFAKSHMEFNADRNKEVEPSLAEMTQSAINILKRDNSRGFLLIVEGGKIDLAHHYNNAFRALDETLQLDEAVEVAMRNLDLSSSLIIVTADHASGMSYSGYATPKNYSVLGLDKYASNIKPNRPYQLLTYSSGIGHQNYNENMARSDHQNTYNKATIPSTWANHAADDVPIYGIGSMANLLFSGTFDQTYLPHAVAYAMCIFPYDQRCLVKPPSKGIEALRQELKKNPHGRPISAENSLKTLRAEQVVSTTASNLNVKTENTLEVNFATNLTLNHCSLIALAIMLSIKFLFY